MYSFIPTTINKLEKSYINAFKLGANDGNPETFQDPALKQQFKSQFLKLCEIEQSKNKEYDLISNFQCSSVDDFDKEYKKEITELKKNMGNPQDTARYKTFADEIDKVVILDANETQNAQNETMIDADMVVKETQMFIDPLSKRQIRDPVKNTLCGHVYEKKTILEAIRLNTRTRCPYMGCNNKRPVSQLHIEEDHQLKAKLHLLFTQMELEEDENDD